jgi:hypothetical protein
MAGPLLDVRDNAPSIGLVPASVKALSGESELDNEIAGQVLRLNLASLFSPQPQQGGLVSSHDGSGIRTTDESAPGRYITYCFDAGAHRYPLSHAPILVSKINSLRCTDISTR